MVFFALPRVANEDPVILGKCMPSEYGKLFYVKVAGCGSLVKTSNMQIYAMLVTFYVLMVTRYYGCAGL